MERGSGRTLSVWLAEFQPPGFEPLKQDLDVDVCVVGAGIAGLSVAYGLARSGRSVVVLEDDAMIGAGETSRTTAHLTNAFDDSYVVVERLHGAEGARLTAESHTAAIDEIERIALQESIECQFERLDGYLMLGPGQEPEILDREFESLRNAGLDEVVWMDRAPLAGYESGRCLRYPRQAQFQPLHYLAGLARAVIERRGRIFTSTHAARIEGGARGVSARVTTDQGLTVTARDVVVATNAPVQNRLTLHTKQYPYRTYVLAARVPKGAVARALFWDTETPYHYVRLHSRPDHDLLIVGGEDHKTGQEEDAVERWARVEAWARERFPQMGAVEVAWSGQILEPMDALAYIGLDPGEENVWVITGDSGNGLTHAAIAGMMLPALMEGNEHPWAKLYEPSRKSLRAGLEFARENLNTAAQYARWLTPGDVDDVSKIPAGEGAVARDGLKKYACYRDEHGSLHRMSAVCPHLGAIVTWNAEERSWDCPAHGSRFDATGKVVNGPANSDLSPAEEHAHERAE
jgi:glycine/D-amino acid oxidase-like deaminating enzyme/nitrite reductase/ring-hydroxylating ferredoxin subunit